MHAIFILTVFCMRAILRLMKNMQRSPEPVIAEIRDRMNAAGVKIKELAEESGVDRWHLTSLLTGYRKNPMYRTIIALERAMDRIESERSKDISQ